MENEVSQHKGSDRHSEGGLSSLNSSSNECIQSKDHQVEKRTRLHGRRSWGALTNNVGCTGRVRRSGVNTSDTGLVKTCLAVKSISKSPNSNFLSLVTKSELKTEQSVPRVLPFSSAPVTPPPWRHPRTRALLGARRAQTPLSAGPSALHRTPSPLEALTTGSPDFHASS